MLAKSVLVCPQGLRPRARAPISPPCYATGVKASEAANTIFKVFGMTQLRIFSCNANPPHDQN